MSHIPLDAVQPIIEDHELVARGRPALASRGLGGADQRIGIFRITPSGVVSP